MARLIELLKSTTNTNLFLKTIVAALLATLYISTAHASALTPVNVTGTVTNSSHTGVSGVSVYATDPGASTVDFGPVTTGSNGTYSLPVTVGTYDFHFIPTGDSNLTPIVDKSHIILNDATIDAQMIPLSHTLSGTITAQDGTPLSDAFIILKNPTTKEQQTTTPDTTGHYSFTTSVGKYNMEVYYDGSYFNGDLDLISSYQFDLTNGDVTQNIQVNFVPLTVNLKDQNGTAIAGASVTAQGNTGTNGASIVVGSNDPTTMYEVINRGTTDSNGSVTFMVAAGTLYGQQYGSVNADNIWAKLPSGQVAYMASPLLVNGPSSVTITQPSSHTISGTVTSQAGSAVPFAQLILKGQNGFKQTALTNSSGYYSLTAPAGSYTLELTYDDSEGGISAHTPQTFDLVSSHQFDLSSGDVTQNLTISFSQLSVTVKDQNGNTVSGVRVQAQANSGTNAASIVPGSSDPTTVTEVISTETSDANGVVTFMVPTGSEYNQTNGTKSNYDNIWAKLPSGQQIYLTAPVAVTGTTNAVVAQSPSHTLSGTLTNQDGTPLQDATIFLRNQTTKEQQTVSTDSTGHYSVTASANTYAMEVYYDGSYINGDIDLYSSHQFDLTSADVIQNLQVNFVPVTVKFNDANGNPIAGARVTAQGNTGTDGASIVVGSNDPTTMYEVINRGTTDSNGSVTFMVPAGTLYGQQYGAINADNIWADLSTGQRVSMASPVLVNGPMTIVIQPEVQVASLAAPTNLNAASPTNSPSLSWSAASGASQYNVYRDGTLIATTSATSYADSSATEGSHGYYVTALNGSTESSPSNTVTVSVDKTAPSNPTLSWNTNPVLSGTNTTLSATTSDTGSGVSGATYTIDNGTPQAMTFNSATNTWQATFGSSLAAGTYNVVVTSTDNAGNTNSGTVDVLVVYSTSNGYINGHAKTLPTASDTLPIALDTSNNPAKLIIGFTNLIALNSGSFSVDYSIKNNQNEFTLTSTGINWVVVNDSTHASVLGTARLVTYVNGVETDTNNVSVRFDITLGANGASDQVSMKVFSPGVDPNTGTPAYTVNDAVIANGSNLTIHP